MKAITETGYYHFRFGLIAALKEKRKVMKTVKCRKQLCNIEIIEEILVRLEKKKMIENPGTAHKILIARTKLAQFSYRFLFVDICCAQWSST